MIIAKVVIGKNKLSMIISLVKSHSGTSHFFIEVTRHFSSSKGSLVLTPLKFLSIESDFLNV